MSKPPSAPKSYPKHPRQIWIRITDRQVEEGTLSGIATTAEVAMSEKLDDYLLRLGYSSAQLRPIFLQLLTKGKVRVDFREHTERVELLSRRDRLTNAQAIRLLEDYIVEVTSPEDREKQVKVSTQRVIIPTSVGKDDKE